MDTKRLWHGISAVALSVALMTSAGVSVSTASAVPSISTTEQTTDSTAKASAVKNLTADVSLNSAKINWEHAPLTGTLSRYVITVSHESGYSRSLQSKDTTVTFDELEQSTDYSFAVITEAESKDGTSWDRASVSIGATTLNNSAPAPTPTPTAPVPTPTPTPTTPVPTAPPLTDTANLVHWKNIAKPGDNIQTVLNSPALVGKTLKLPAGVFEVSNFQNGNVGIRIPSNVKGVDGAGNDTILRIKERTSTHAASIPKQGSGQTNQLYIVRMNDSAQSGVGAQTLSNLWIQGTEQGHLYNGIMTGKSASGTTVKNILITGIPGDAGSPPGETFGLNWWKSNESITRNVEVDGYRWTGDSFATRVKGEKVGSSPIGYNDSHDARLYDAYTHDSKTGMPTFWQSDRAQTWNLQSIGNNAGINHEESWDIVHNQPVITGSANRQHISFMSARADGKLTIIGATVDGWTGKGVAGPIGKGQKLLVLTPTNYTGPNTNKIVTKPTVVLDDGVTPQPYTWAH